MQSTLQCATEAFILANQIKDSLRIVRTGRIKSQALKRLGNIETAISLYNEILPTARRHYYLTELKAILNGLGSSYLFKANYDKALRFYFESLELRQRDGDKFEISIVLN